MSQLDFSILQEWETISLLLQGLKNTVIYTLIGFLLSLIIGVIIAFGQMSKVKSIRSIALVYLAWFRGTPLLVQLFLLYYGLPIIFGIETEAWVAGVLGLGMYSGSYVSQIVRGAIQSTEKGQMEAGRSLGFSHFQTMQKIILPQATARMLAPLTNELISLSKNSSLLSSITVLELFRQSNLLIANTYKTMEILFAVAITYFIINNIIGAIGLFLEKKTSFGGDLR